MPYSDPLRKSANDKQYRRNRWLNDPAYRESRLASLDQFRRDREAKRAVYEQVMEAFKAGGCVACGERDGCCLDAHHRDPASKRFKVADWVAGSKAGKAVKVAKGVDSTNAEKGQRLDLDDLLAELKNCVCVCANCHRKVHQGVIEL